MCLLELGLITVFAGQIAPAQTLTTLASLGTLTDITKARQSRLITNQAAADALSIIIRAAQAAPQLLVNDANALIG